MHSWISLDNNHHYLQMSMFTHHLQCFLLDINHQNVLCVQKQVIFNFAGDSFSFLISCCNHHSSNPHGSSILCFWALFLISPWQHFQCFLRDLKAKMECINWMRRIGLMYLGWRSWYPGVWNVGVFGMYGVRREGDC